MDEEGDSPQLWLHSASAGASARPRSSSNFYTSTLFMVIVPTVALLLLLLTFSSVPSLTCQILKPISVKKSWDSLNVLLVLFAIVCGTFARWNEDVEGNTESHLDIQLDQVSNDHQLRQPSSPTSSHERKWYELSYDSSMHVTASHRGRLQRNSSSYPDLRQQSNWEITGEHGFKYYDDFEIARINQLLEKQPKEIVVGQGILRRKADPDAKVIPLSTYPSQQDSAARSLSLQANHPSSPPPPPPVQKKIRGHPSVTSPDRMGTEKAARTSKKQPEIENKAARTTKKQPEIENKGIRHSSETSLRSQAKARRRHKVSRDLPVKEGRQNSSTSESSSVAVSISPTSPLHVTNPPKDEYIKPASETTSLHHPKEPQVKRTVPKQKREIESEVEATPSPSPPPPPPPPPPTSPQTIFRPDQVVKKERKKSSAKREIAMVWASIYKGKKKQNQPEQQQQQQQVGRADSGNYNGISHLFYEPESTSTSQVCTHPSPPPPPPPPPPHSVFHSLFRKTGSNKSKKIHSVPAPPPPPPPPPCQSFITPPPQVTPPRRSSAGKPPLPKRPTNYGKDEYRYVSNSVSQCPVPDIPRPPPLPPFGVPETIFMVQGDLAKMGSSSSWRSGCLEADEFEGQSLVMEWSGGEAALCPSPDVNAKAETFIARLRGEWRLEKMKDA